MSARRLPAYGLQLAQARDRGHHPPRACVIYGMDWQRLPPDRPALCVAPGYRARRCAWDVVAGLEVDVVAREFCAEDLGPLLGDIARHAAPVALHFRTGADDWLGRVGARERIDAADMAFVHRRPAQRDSVGYRWPRWWSDQLHKDYARRRRAWRIAAATPSLAAVS